MNLPKECIQQVNVGGTVYYQMPELVQNECRGCAIRNYMNGPICNELYDRHGYCEKGIWITADMKDEYCVAAVTTRLEGETT